MEFRRRNLSRRRRVFSFGRKLALLLLFFGLSPVFAYIIFADFGSDTVSANHHFSYNNGYRDPNWVLDGIYTEDSGWVPDWNNAGPSPVLGGLRFKGGTSLHDDFRFLDNYDTINSTSTNWIFNNGWDKLNVLWRDADQANRNALNTRVRNQEPYLLLSSDVGRMTDYSYRKTQILLDLWVKSSSNSVTLEAFDLCASGWDIFIDENIDVTIEVLGLDSAFDSDTKYDSSTNKLTQSSFNSHDWQRSLQNKDTCIGNNLASATIGLGGLTPLETAELIAKDNPTRTDEYKKFLVKASIPALDSLYSTSSGYYSYHNSFRLRVDDSSSYLTVANGDSTIAYEQGEAIPPGSLNYNNFGVSLSNSVPYALGGLTGGSPVDNGYNTSSPYWHWDYTDYVDKPYGDPPALYNVRVDDSKSSIKAAFRIKTWGVSFIVAPDISEVPCGKEDTTVPAYIGMYDSDLHGRTEDALIYWTTREEWSNYLINNSNKPQWNAETTIEFNGIYDADEATTIAREQFEGNDISSYRWEDIRHDGFQYDRVYKVQFSENSGGQYRQYRVPFDYANTLKKCKQESTIGLTIDCQLYVQKLFWEDDTNAKLELILRRKGTTLPRRSFTYNSLANSSTVAGPQIQIWYDQVGPLAAIGPYTNTPSDLDYSSGNNLIANLVRPSELLYSSMLNEFDDFEFVLTGRYATDPLDGTTIMPDDPLDTLIEGQVIPVIPDPGRTIPRSYEDCLGYRAKIMARDCKIRFEELYIVLPGGIRPDLHFEVLEGTTPVTQITYTNRGPFSLNTRITQPNLGSTLEILDLTDADTAWFNRARNFTFQITGYYDTGGAFQQFQTTDAHGNIVVITPNIDVSIYQPNLPVDNDSCVPPMADCTILQNNLFTIDTVATPLRQGGQASSHSASGSLPNSSLSSWSNGHSWTTGSPGSPGPPPTPSTIQHHSHTHTGSYRGGHGASGASASFNFSELELTTALMEVFAEKALINGDPGEDGTDTTTVVTGNSRPVRIRPNFDVTTGEVYSDMRKITWSSSLVENTGSSTIQSIQWHGNANDTSQTYYTYTFTVYLKSVTPTSDSSPIYNPTPPDTIANDSLILVTDNRQLSRSTIQTYLWDMDWKLDITENIERGFTWISWDRTSSAGHSWPPSYGWVGHDNRSTATNTLTWRGNWQTCSRTMVVQLPECTIINMSSQEEQFDTDGNGTAEITEVYPVGATAARTRLRLVNPNIVSLKTTTSHHPEFSIRGGSPFSYVTYNADGTPRPPQIFNSYPYYNGDPNITASTLDVNTHIPANGDYEYDESQTPIGLPGKYLVIWKPKWQTDGLGDGLWNGAEHVDDKCYGQHTVAIFIWADPPLCRIEYTIFEVGDPKTEVVVTLTNPNEAPMDIRSAEYTINRSGSSPPDNRTGNGLLNSNPITVLPALPLSRKHSHSPLPSRYHSHSSPGSTHSHRPYPSYQTYHSYPASSPHTHSSTQPHSHFPAGSGSNPPNSPSHFAPPTQPPRPNPPSVGAHPSLPTHTHGWPLSPGDPDYHYNHNHTATYGWVTQQVWNGFNWFTQLVWGITGWDINPSTSHSHSYMVSSVSHSHSMRPHYHDPSSSHANLHPPQIAANSTVVLKSPQQAIWENGIYDVSWSINTNMGNESWTTRDFAQTDPKQNSWFANDNERITVTGPTGTVECKQKMRIAVRPYLKVFYGDVSAGGYFGLNEDYDACGDDNIIRTWSSTASSEPEGYIAAHAEGSNPTDARGASVRHGIQAYDLVAGFYSSSQRNSLPQPLKGLTLNNVGSGDYDGGFGKPNCVGNYWREVSELEEEENLTTNDIEINLNSDLQDNDRRRYVLKDNQKLIIKSNNTSLGDLKATLFVEGQGNVYIENDIINNDAASWEDPSQIGYIAIITRGNIYINPSVRKIDAVLVAYPKHYDSTLLGAIAYGGEIWTCYFDGITAATHFNRCNNPLVVNGALIAQKVRLGRIYKSVKEATGTPEYDHSNSSSEMVNLLPEYLLGTPELPIFPDQIYKSDSISVHPVNF